MRPHKQRAWTMATALAVLVVFSVPLTPRGAAAADSLSDLRSAVRTRATPEPTSRPESEDKRAEDRERSNLFANDDEGEEDNGFGTWIAGGALAIAAAPYWGPVKLAQDDYDAQGVFTSYPYQHGDGTMAIELPDGRMKNLPGTGAWLARFGSEFGTNFSGTSWIGGQMLLDTSFRFGLDSEFRRLEEAGPHGTEDALWQGDTNVVFRFAQNERFQMRSGLGVNFLDDQEGSDFGFNFTYGGDWTPAQPLIFSSALDWGKLGHATLAHLRTTAGINWRHAETFLGYDYLRVGHYDLNGLVAGLRLWF